MENNYRLYAKFENMKSFKAVNWKDGRCVGNLFYASIFDETEANIALKEAIKCNPEAQFKLVKIHEIRQ